MSTCWYCHWGWAVEVADIYDRYVEEFGADAMRDGPAHIIWADENFEAYHVEESFVAAREMVSVESFYSVKEIEAAVGSLRELVELGEAVYNIEPEEYGGEHPEYFPPKCAVRKV